CGVFPWGGGPTDLRGWLRTRRLLGGWLPTLDPQTAAVLLVTEAAAGEDAHPLGRPGGGADAAESWLPACGRAVRAGRGGGGRGGQCGLLRCVFGNPFRPLAPFDASLLTWNNGLVAHLAQAAYEERLLPEGTLDNARLAVLADALEEVGAPEEVLAHLRAPGP